MKCFYHSADLDGHCSGALIKMAYPNCEMIGINYGDEFPWTTIKQGELVYMVDFSLQPFSGMLRLDNICQLVWIDHHKSSIEEATQLQWNIDNKKLKVGIGACYLVWQYINKGLLIPTFIKLLAEYDVWNHSDPRILPFQYGMRQIKNTNPENQDFWLSLFDVEMVNRIGENGAIILDYQNSENEKYASACAFKTELDGLKCVTINKMLTNSKVFDSVWDESKYDAMMSFGFRKGQWTVSLYSTKDTVDVSEIAKNRGGGGHKGAAGFQCEELPFKLGNI